MDHPRYPVLLLDADGTLYDFEKSQSKALEAAYLGIGADRYVPYSEEILLLYSRINQNWWDKLEKGECTKPELQINRFRDFTKELHLPLSPEEINLRYVDELGNGTYLLPHAQEVCERLSACCRMYIVTNGISRTQHRRIGNSSLAPFFQEIFVSEDAGAPKPDKAYFDYVFSKLGHVDPQEILLVGDSLSSDILGAYRAGIDSCWFNPSHEKNTGTIRSTYELDDIRGLLGIVFSSEN